jgi:hypothetical protein
MGVLLLRCFVDASLRHGGRPLAAWLRHVGTEVGALVHQVQAEAGLGGDGSLGSMSLLELPLRAVEVLIQATPHQCTLIAERIAREQLPIFLIKVVDDEQSTFFAPA